MDMTQHPPRAGARTLLWLVFLAGPLIWCSYFSLVYMVAEAACATNRGVLDFSILGMPALSALVLATTALATLATLFFTWQSYRIWSSARRALRTVEQRNDLAPEARTDARTAGERSQFMAFAGLLLSLSFLVATLYTGLPALVLRPC
jgi:hypothetical protein